MIADTMGQDIEIIRENQIGIYDTCRVVATYCYELPDGRHRVRTINGEEFTTIPSTVVKELRHGQPKN